MLIFILERNTRNSTIVANYLYCLGTLETIKFRANYLYCKGTLETIQLSANYLYWL